MMAAMDLSGSILLPGDADAFRRAWRGMGSTVTLVATEHEGVAHAMLATAVSSVSMDPPSLLVCVNRSATSHASLRARGAFSLGILGSDCRDVAAAMAQASAAERLSHGTWRALEAPARPIDGLPWLAEAQATLFCVLDSCVDSGTHAILIARVAATTAPRDADPLLYSDGGYGRFAPL